MKLFFLYSILFLLTACSLFKPTDEYSTEPKLIKQAPLPEVPHSIQRLNFQFYCEMIVDEQGNVIRAKLLESSGDRQWDSLTVLSLYNWKFTPAMVEGSPIKTLIRRKVNVIFVESNIITLAEIVCSTKAEADSVYEKLNAGENFHDLAKKFSKSNSKNSGGHLGKVDIQHYTLELKLILSKLKTNQHSKPVQYGNGFAIFKRLKDH